MSYEKHTWETGETITAEKLNNIEDGIASASGGDSRVFYVNIQGRPGSATFDKTFDEMLEAYNNGKLVAFVIQEAGYFGVAVPAMNEDIVTSFTAYQITYIDSIAIQIMGIKIDNSNNINFALHKASVKS